MRDAVEIVRTRARSRLAQAFAVITAAAAVAMLFLWEAASAPSVSPVRAGVRPVVQQVQEAPPPAAEPGSRADPSDIREAHSDGGYQYWLEQHPQSAVSP